MRQVGRFSHEDRLAIVSQNSHPRMDMAEVPNEYRVRLSNFTEQDLEGSFCSFTLGNEGAEGHGVFRAHPLDNGQCAVQIISPDEGGSDACRFLTQAEVDSIHFAVRSDGIKELRVRLA